MGFDVAQMRVWILYTNHRGETADRVISPVNIHFGSTEWHPEPQWLLYAYCFEKEAWRDFAMAGIKEWRRLAVSPSK